MGGTRFEANTNSLAVTLLSRRRVIHNFKLPPSSSSIKRKLSGYQRIAKLHTATQLSYKAKKSRSKKRKKSITERFLAFGLLLKTYSGISKLSKSLRSVTAIDVKSIRLNPNLA